LAIPKRGIGRIREVDKKGLICFEIDIVNYRNRDGLTRLSR